MVAFLDLEIKLSGKYHRSLQSDFREFQAAHIHAWRNVTGVLSCNGLYPKNTKEVSQLSTEMQTVQLYQHSDGCKEILAVRRTHQPGTGASISALYYVRLCENTFIVTTK